MIPVPTAVRTAIDGVATVGDLDQAFVLLTPGPAGEVDVCLLSRSELRTTPERVLAVVGSSKARRNLAASGTATLVAVVDDAAHYLYLEGRRSLADEGLLAVELVVVRALIDDLGVELQPMRFRVEERLRVEERWGTTGSMLDRLERSGAQA